MKMEHAVRVIKSTLVAMLVISLGSHCTAQEKPRVEIASLSIAKKDPGSEFGQSLSQFKNPGLELEVYFRLPDQTVLSIDAEKSEATLTSDDGGELPLRDGFDGPFDLNLQESRNSGTIQIQSENLPGRKTTKLSLNGIFALIVGKDKKTEVVELKIAEGSKVKLGPVSAEISQVGDAYGDPFKQMVELSAKESFDSIAQIEFLDSKGNVIESSSAGSGRMGFNDDITYSSSWQIASEAKTLKMRVSYFSKTESIKLPAKLESGSGLLCELKTVSRSGNQSRGSLCEPDGKRVARTVLFAERTTTMCGLIFANFWHNHR